MNEHNGTADRPARMVNGYALMEQIGSGGMSRVYRAEHRQSGETVAVKAIPIEDLAADYERRLRREPEIQHSLRHDNIVALLDWFRVDDEFYLVMEYVAGESLSEKIRRAGPMPFPQARGVMRQLLRAVYHLHELSVIHRDIKPGNVLIDREGNAKLTDFGIAKFQWQQGETRTQKGLGTPEYMSPEQVRGTNIDWRTDIYSLGVTLFEMLTGKKPFSRGEDTPAGYADTVRKILSEPLPDPRALRANLPDGVVEVLRKATAKSPDDRYQTCAEFLGALELIDEKAVSSPSTVVLNSPNNGAFAPVPPVVPHGGPRTGTAGAQPVPPVTARVASEAARSESGKGILWVVLALLVLATAGYFGYRWYEDQRRATAPLTPDLAAEIANDIGADYERFARDGNVPALVTLYAPDGVDYYRLRNVSRDAIRRDAEKFYSHITSTNLFELEVDRARVVDDSTIRADFVIKYERVKDDNTILRGETADVVTIRRIDDEWLIVGQSQKWIRRDNVQAPVIDSTADDTTDAVEPVEPVVEPPTAGEMQSTVQSIAGLASSGGAAEAFDRYASSDLKGRQGGFPDILSVEGIRLLDVRVSGDNALATFVRSQDDVDTEVRVSFRFVNENGPKVASVNVVE